jgi:hypothetical protein
MRPDDMQGWMLNIAKAAGEAGGNAHNLVFVMRRELTKAYQAGFEEGLHAADRDDFVRGEIERAAKERGDAQP